MTVFQSCYVLYIEKSAGFRDSVMLCTVLCHGNVNNAAVDRTPFLPL